MNELLVGPVSLGILVILIALGTPIGAAMGVIALAGLYFTIGPTFLLSTIQSLPYLIASNYAYAVLPMFMLMGAITAYTGITTDLYNVFNKWLGHVKGGLYYVTIMAAGAFGAINGSTIVSAVVFSKIAIPEMLRHGYPPGLSAATVCCAGTFAALIPPSISLIIYGLLADESVGQLLMAGILPGVVTIVVYVIGLGLYLKVFPQNAPQRVAKASLKDRVSSLRSLWPVIILFVGIMGGIYTGTILPAAAGAVGAFGATIIPILQRRLTFRAFTASIHDTFVVSASIFLVVIGGLLLSRYFVASGFIDELVQTTQDSSLTATQFVIFVIILYLILGMFIDTVSLVVMTVPILHPLALSFGLNPIWFGVVIVKLVEIAVITPPVGLNLYALLGATKGKIRSADLFKGILPFLLFELISLTIITAFPTISLIIPNTMLN